MQRPNAIKLDWSHEIHTGLIWLRDNLCLLVVSCLEDEKSLAVSIGEIIRSIKSYSSRNGSIFGVVFSLTHCSVVRLEVGGEGIAVKHTPILDFLPSSRATERSTPGITALVRLMVHLTKDALQDAIRVLKPVNRGDYFDDPLFCGPVINSTIPSLPVEICDEIVKYLDTIDIVNFAHLSPAFHQAASYTLRYPRIQIQNDYYLLRKEASQIAGNPLNDPAEVNWRVLRKRLTCSAFHATHPGHGNCLVTLGIRNYEGKKPQPLSSDTAWLSLLSRQFSLGACVYEAGEEAMRRFMKTMSLV